MKATKTRRKVIVRRTRPSVRTATKPTCPRGAAQGERAQHQDHEGGPVPAPLLRPEQSDPPGTDVHSGNSSACVPLGLDRPEATDDSEEHGEGFTPI